MRPEFVVRQMKTKCERELERMEKGLLADPPDTRGLSELVRDLMHLRIDLLKWVLAEGKWPSSTDDVGRLYDRGGLRALSRLSYARGRERDNGSET